MIPRRHRVATLDEVSRLQQVDDGCFATLAEIPAQAVTLTIPALLSAAELFCMVPGAQKKRAVTNALYGPIDGSVPASACAPIHDAPSASTRSPHPRPNDRADLTLTCGDDAVISARSAAELGGLIWD